MSKPDDAVCVLRTMQAFYSKQETPTSAAMADVLLYAISAIDTLKLIELAVTRHRNFWLQLPEVKG